MTDQFLHIRGGPTANDLGVWPNPQDPGDVEWSLRHLRTTLGREPSTSDLMVAASFIHAYRALIAMPQRERNKRIEQIKAAITPSADSSNGDDRG